MGSRQQVAARSDPDPDDIYVTTFTVRRTRCLVAMHADTRLSVAILDVRTAQFRHLAALLGDEFARLLGDMVLPTDLIAIAPDSEVSSTGGHPVVGHLQQIEAHVCEHLAEQDLSPDELRAMNLALQQLPDNGTAGLGSPQSRAMARWERQLMAG